MVKAARERGANRGGGLMAEEIAGRVAAVKLSAPPPPPSVSKSSPKVVKSSAGGGKSPTNARRSISRYLSSRSVVLDTVRLRRAFWLSISESLYDDQ